MSMIDSEKLIEELGNWYLVYNDGSWNEAIDKVKEIIESQPPAVGIDKQKQIEELEKVKTGYGEGLLCEKGCGNFENCPECVLARVQEIIESQPPADQWVPVSKQMPKYGEKCQVTIKIKDVYVRDEGTYMKGCWWIRGERIHIGHVIAWMPLPEPYKGVE